MSNVNVVLMRVACAAGLLAWAAPAAWAWNSTGHETVALVAYDQLSPAERGKLAGILNRHPRYQKDLLMDLQPGDDQATAAFITAATWPDIVRSPVNPLQPKENHPIWHYVDFPYDLHGGKGPAQVTDWDGKSLPQNLSQAMQKETAEFSNPSTSAARRAIDLCWIEHLVGDIHQPLHAVSMYSPEYPNGDQGGNQVSYMPPVDPQTGEQVTSNLHSFWDGLMGRKLNLADIRPIADRVEHEHPLDSIAGPAHDLTLLDWAHESHDLAVADVYCNGNIPGVPRAKAHEDPSAAPLLSDEYQSKAHQVGDLRVALAGYRLANELHQLLAALPTTGPTTAPAMVP